MLLIDRWVVRKEPISMLGLQVPDARPVTETAPRDHDADLGMKILQYGTALLAIVVAILLASVR